MMMLVSEYSKNNCNVPVVDKWENAGFLNGISEEEKKYLADLYDALTDDLGSENGIINKNNLRGVLLYGFNDSIASDVDMEVSLESMLMSLIRKVYEFGSNKSFSFLDFANVINELSFSNSEINTLISSDNKKLTCLTLVGDKVMESFSK